MITIIHPSRSRPQLAYQTALRWVERIGLPETEFEYILSLDNDDPELWSYKNKFPCLNFTIFRGDNRSAIDAINFPAKFYSAYRGQEENSKDFLIVISDDFDCPEYWGKSLIKETIDNYKSWILKTKDGIQDWVITLPIMDWHYYRIFNYVYYPDYKHAWSDTEMTCVAELTGRIQRSDLFFEHKHHSLTGKKDKTSDRSDSFFEQGRTTFQQRININFNLPEHWIVSKMSPNVYSRMRQ
jgi:hypothetical protein